MRRARRTIARTTLLLFPLTLLANVAPAAAADPPTLRLFTTADEVTVAKDRRDQVVVDPGAWITPVGGAFEVWAGRPDYDTPVSLVQVDAVTGEVVRTLPTDLLEGWFGFKDFLHATVRDADGDLVVRTKTTFCPNAYGRSRISDEGPLMPSYPFFCGGTPFTLGTVYGIDAGWATQALGDYYYGSPLQFRADGRRFTVTLWIDNAWAEALRVAPADARVSVAVRVVDRGSASQGEPPVPDDLTQELASRSSVPETTSPPADALPDLVALPAWSIGTYSRRGTDLLTFNATEWNAGPGILEVEGFRERNAEEMDAFQYFLQDGVPAARAPVGNLAYHAEHRHWHFEQFTRYSLIGASSGDVQISGKQSWCLANTDAIDLTRPNANWAAYGGDLFTMCGSQNAIWIREVLDVGWGDTYGQYIPGQAFDITDVPNGRYIIRVEVNPDHLILEGSMDNNVQDRLIRIRGRQGARTVTVEPWHGIEDGCYYC